MAGKIIEAAQSFEDKLRIKREEYAKAFRIDDLNDANDRSNLDMMLKTEIMVDDIQEQIKSLMEEDVVSNVAAIKKLSDLLKDARDTVLTIQRNLAIDRKTRKTEETASVADYIRTLKREAKDFMEQRIIRVYCPDCKVMVGRIFPVHDHTAFSCAFQCSQCSKLIRARREDKDVLFDIKDAAWRRRYKTEVVQPKKFSIMAPGDQEDDLIINADPELQTDNIESVEVQQLEDEHIIGE